MRNLRKLLAVGVAASLTAALAGCNVSVGGGTNTDDTDKPTLKGKSVTFVVNYAAGGPSDAFARVLVKHLEGHLPGEPRVVVENVTGAGGALGANKVFGADPDGTTIGVLTDTAGPPLFQPESVEYDMAEWSWIGSASDSQIITLRTDTGVTDAADLAEAPRPLKVGGLAPATGVDIQQRILYDAVGIDYKMVTGYHGANAALTALDQGEIDGFATAVGQYLTQQKAAVDAGDLIPLAQSGIAQADGTITRDQRVPDIPTIAEYLETLGVTTTSGEKGGMSVVAQGNALLRAIVAPPGMSEALLGELRTAYLDTMRDPAFIKDFTKLQGGEVAYSNGADALDLVKRRTETVSDPDTMAYLTKITQP